MRLVTFVAGGERRVGVLSFVGHSMISSTRTRRD